MIKIKGTAIIRVQYEVELPFSVEKFDGMSEVRQNEYIQEYVDWYHETKYNSEIDEIEVWDVEEVEESE